MLVGSADTIARARLYRKRLGGGMRQVGVLAAPGLIALETMPARLAEDHANARLLAEGLARVDGLSTDLTRAQTNIVIADVTGTGLTGAEFSQALHTRGVLANAVSETAVRFVTHYDVSREQCQTALAAITEAALLARGRLGR